MERVGGEVQLRPTAAWKPPRVEDPAPHSRPHIVVAAAAVPEVIFRPVPKVT
jgi:hypothetical protein